MFIPMWLVIIGGIALSILVLTLMFMGVLLLGSFLVWVRNLCKKAEDNKCPYEVESDKE